MVTVSARSELRMSIWQYSPLPSVSAYRLGFQFSSIHTSPLYSQHHETLAKNIYEYDSHIWYDVCSGKQ